VVLSGPNAGRPIEEDSMSVSIFPTVPKKHVRGLALAVALGTVGLGAPMARAQDDGAVKQVNCDGGQSLADAVKHSKEGQTLQVHGTCRERVPIRTPRLTLAGVGTAVIDGTGVGLGADPEFDGLVVIDGVTGVILAGLTIQNSAGNGILAQHGAAVAVRDLRVQNNAFTGIVVVDHSSAELTNSATAGNRLGLDVVTSSSAVLKGTFSSSHNANGVDVNGTSIVELRGAQVELNENDGYGLIAASGSHLGHFRMAVRGREYGHRQRQWLRRPRLWPGDVDGLRSFGNQRVEQRLRHAGE
jgi:hypothetical protein